MRYIVIESKIYENDSFTVTPFTYNDRTDAEQKFLQLASAAVKSERPMHAIILMTSEGQLIERKVYHHTVEVEPEPEPETVE